MLHVQGVGQWRIQGTETTRLDTSSSPAGQGQLASCCLASLDTTALCIQVLKGHLSPLPCGADVEVGVVTSSLVDAAHRTDGQNRHLHPRLLEQTPRERPGTPDRERQHHIQQQQ